jgi:hypothetical protein
MKEVQPSSMHKISSNPHLGTQYPYFDLCKDFLCSSMLSPNVRHIWQIPLAIQVTLCVFTHQQCGLTQLLRYKSAYHSAILQ